MDMVLGIKEPACLFSSWKSQANIITILSSKVRNPVADKYEIFFRNSFHVIIDHNLLMKVHKLSCCSLEQRAAIFLVYGSSLFQMLALIAFPSETVLTSWAKLDSLFISL